ncbi:hypothetical protein [Anaerovorax odorimutans]|uniref:hypothetical protein n=1 Tax=Anaerovorax odorimutans TaxID=109327 RepID=UPI000400727E|nr:hypothetical protein [Anaerovorax odorimutans]
MKNEKIQKLGIAALIISILPLATFVPVLFKITLSDVVRNIWSGVNIVFAFTALCLSVICIRISKRRNIINIISIVISIFWVMILLGIVALALLLNFLQ